MRVRETRAPSVLRGVRRKRADVRRYADVEQAIGAAVRRFGGLDILVNNAGVGVFTNVAEMTPVQWADVIETNLTGVFNACHVALPHLRRRGGGFIINISSLSGKNPFAGAAAYCASKAGLNAFSEALMQEVRYDGIRVSYVMPGSVATGFGGGDPSKGDDWKIAPDEVAEVVVNLLRHDPRSLPSRVELRPSNHHANENIHLRQTPRHARAPRNDDGHGARASGRRARSADRFARARRGSTACIAAANGFRASRAWTSRSCSSSWTMRNSSCRARWRNARTVEPSCTRPVSNDLDARTIQNPRAGRFRSAGRRLSRP